MNLSSLQNGSDIRGVALGEHPTLTPENADLLSRAFVVWLAKQTKKSQVRVAVGMDSRLSGPALKQACLKALQDSGAFVIDCGMASTPAMFMTTVSPHTKCDGAIMITASHLPSDRNGMKFFTTRGGLESSEIKQLIALAEAPLPHELQGSVSSCDFISLYAADLRQKIISETGCNQPLAGLNIMRRCRQRRRRILRGPGFGAAGCRYFRQPVFRAGRSFPKPYSKSGKRPGHGKPGTGRTKTQCGFRLDF